MKTPAIRGVGAELADQQPSGVADEILCHELVARQEHVRRRGDVLCERFRRISRGDFSVAQHGLQHVTLSILRRRPVEKWAVQGRTFDDAGEHRGLGQVEVLRLLVEVDLRRGPGAPRGIAEENAVQIHLEDLWLRETAFDLEREQGLANLAVDRWSVTDESQLGELLRKR